MREQCAVGFVAATGKSIRPPRFSVAVDISSSLPGWLIVLPRKHIVGLNELDDDAAANLGRLLRDASQALINTVGCTKTYVMEFGEKEGFQHLHFHLVPRMPNIPADRQGPAIFGYYDGNPLTESQRDELAKEITQNWPKR